MVLIDVQINKEKNETLEASSVDSHWASLQTNLYQSELTCPPPASGLLTASRTIETLMSTTVVVESSRIRFEIDVTYEGVATGNALAKVSPLNDGFRVEIEQRELFKGSSHGSSAKRLIVRDYQIPACSTYDWSHLNALLTPDGHLLVSVFGSSSFLTTPITEVPIQFSPPFSSLKADLFGRKGNVEGSFITDRSCSCPGARLPCTNLVPQWLFHQ